RVRACHWNGKHSRSPPVCANDPRPTSRLVIRARNDDRRRRTFCTIHRTRRRRMTTTTAQPFKDPAMNPLTPRKITQLHRIPYDAADNHEKAVITPNDLHDLLDHASKDNA